MTGYSDNFKIDRNMTGVLWLDHHPVKNPLNFANLPEANILLIHKRYIFLTL
jgi:hypothetical protein